MDLGLALGLIIGLPIIAAVAFFIIGAKVVSAQMKKQLRENPPINEAQIRAMYSQMGRKPTEQQVKQVMNSFKNNIDKK
ncbi:MAG: YneF family protein [Mycoplasmataceae bacterium]|jgi:uncharacterized protein YneF (UPF0154 family)|nr:YneF family protein [Mycoplasmataceae bacterium]